LLIEIREAKKFLVRSRKILLWAITIIGGAILLKFGNAIWDVFARGIGA
jgi:hypothetical protein